MGAKTAVSAALLVVAGGLAGWIAKTATLPPAAGGESEEEGASVAPADMSVEVVTAKATSGDLTLTVPVIGAVRADEDAIVTLSSQAGGRVADLSVRAGDEVKAGQEIARFDVVPLQTSADQAAIAGRIAANELEEFDRVGRDKEDAELDAAARRAEADLAVAEASLARVVALRKDGLVSEKAEAEARQAVDHAQRDRDISAKALASFRTAGADLHRARLVAAVDAAKAAEAAAAWSLAGAHVLAPADGRILTLAVHVGDLVESGAPVGTLLRPDGRVIAFGVTPAQAADVTPAATVTWSDASGAERHAKIRSISPAVADGAGLVEILAVPDGDAPPPGLVVRGEIETRRLTGVTLVPRLAVVRAEDAPTVVVVGEGGISRRVGVEVLGRHGELDAVKGEVKDGDRVVVEGAYNLPDGAKTHEGQEEHGEEPGSGK